MKRLLVTAFLLIPALAIASDAPDVEKPMSPMAIAAIKKHDDAISSARKVYLKSQAAAEQQLVSDLDKALTFAMHSKNATDASLKEANRISAAKAEAAKRLQADAGDGAAAWLVGTSWNMRNRQMPHRKLDNVDAQADMKYLADGVVEERLKPDSAWVAIDENTIVESQPGPTGLKTQVTFSSDRRFAFRFFQDPTRPETPYIDYATRSD
jgi:hypothetical protein